MMDPTLEMSLSGLQLQPPVQGTEKLYGWYPPAYSPFSKPNYKQLGSYEEEARYRHQASMFHNTAAENTQQESSVFHRPPTIMSHRSNGSKSADHSHRTGPGLSAKMDGIRQELLKRQMENPLFKRLTPERPATASSNVFNYQSEKSRKTQRPVFTAVPSAWCPRYPEPDLRRCWSPVQSSDHSRPSTASSVSLPASAVQPKSPVSISIDRPASPLPADTNSAERRLESGAGQRRTGRPKTAPALLRKQSPQPPAAQQQGSSSTPQHRVHTSYQRQVAAMASMVPAATELEPKAEEEEEVHDEEEKDETGSVVPEENGAVTEELTQEARDMIVADLLEDPYDQALKVHGWKMEVHGDPLGLKSKVLQKRLPITVKIPEPQVLPQPPRMVKENKETFFQRTLPNGALSFDIHPDFPSERFNSKRQELQRKGRWNYAVRDFSFVY